MAALVSLPRLSDAFSAYKPSTNAHTDILTGAADTGGRVVRLERRDTTSNDENTINILTSAVPHILAGEPPSTSMHTVAAACRRHVLAHGALPPVYEVIDAELEKCATQMAKERRASIMGREGGWLARLVSVWEIFTSRVALLGALFVYLDRVHGREAGASSISDRATRQFRLKIWDDRLLFGKTRDDLLAWAASERTSGEIDVEQRGIMRAVIALATTLGMFSSLSEPYVEQVKEHYDSLASATVDDIDAGTHTGTEFVQWMVDKEGEERDRAADCFGAAVANDVVDAVRAVAADMADRVVRKALDEAMYRADTDSLGRLFTFSKRAKAASILTKAMHAHIESRIRSVISDPANDRQMIDSTLKLKRFVDTAVASLFAVPDTPLTSDDEDKESVPAVPKLSAEERNLQLELEQAVRSGFKAGLGSRQNAPAEWIAKHLDAVMRKGQGTSSEAQFNELLDEIVALVGYTPDKDVFRAFYSTGLAKRLLLNKSASDDMERNMIVKLQKEMGDEFTSGDVMMKDLQLSETLVRSYQSARAKNPSEFKDHSDFTANVLTESAWPPYPLLKDGWDFKLPPQLQSSIDTFTEWYATQHKNRALSWRHQLATVTLTARFTSGKYEIGVSLFQAVVMLLFNEEDVLDFNEVKSRTGIESSELVRTLQSLSLGRKGTRVLVKRPAGKEVEPTDKFGINKAFTSERTKFRINQIQQDLSAEESHKTNEQVALDRVSVLEATIVRIMKSRKTLTLQLLIDAVVSDVSKAFPPDVKEIKKRVESLIDREYLCRDDNDRNTLNYLA